MWFLISLIFRYRNNLPWYEGGRVTDESIDLHGPGKNNDHHWRSLFLPKTISCAHKVISGPHWPFNHFLNKMSIEPIKIGRGPIRSLHTVGDYLIFPPSKFKGLQSFVEDLIIPILILIKKWPLPLWRPLILIWISGLYLPIEPYPPHDPM